MFYQKTNSTILDFAELQDFLPASLVKEIIFHQNKELLSGMFKDFGSENLIKELSAVLTTQIFLPDDYIINKGELGEEMYFIVQGSVSILAGDKQTVVAQLDKGSYFGEIAIFFSTRRTSYVQSDTFTIVNTLKKSDLDEIVQSFPLVAVDIEKQAKERMKVLKEFDTDTMAGDEEGQTYNPYDENSFMSDDNVSSKSRNELLQSSEEKRAS